LLMLEGYKNCTCDTNTDEFYYIREKKKYRVNVERL
jgi:hypothetical protein